MISLSSIIKSVAVVDDRPQPDRFMIQLNEELERSVIKRQALSGQTPVKGRKTFDRDELQEELNRMRIEIADAQRELRLAKRDLDDATRAVAELEQQREALEQYEGLVPDEQAKALIQEAEQKAAQIVEWAKQEAADSIDQLKAQGYLDGLEQGASEAQTRFYEEHEPDMKKLEALMTGLGSLRDEMIAEYENDIISLIIATAERVIGKTLEDDPLTVVDMLRSVLEQHRRESFVKVTISPELLTAEAKVADNVRNAIQQIGQQIDITVDTEAAPGTMLVETSGGFTDLSVQTQLENMHEALLEG